MPGLLRAERRLRPRRGADPRRPRRRRVADHRPESVDFAGARRRLVLRAGAHRPGSSQAPRPVLPAGADEAAGRAGAADPADHRRLGVQRGLLRRGGHRRRERRGPARRRLAGSHRHPRVRTRRRHPRPAARLRPRARPGDPAGASRAASRPGVAGRGRRRLGRVADPAPPRAAHHGHPEQDVPGVEASVAKLLWAPWHQRLGELAMSRHRAAATVAPTASSPTCSGCSCSPGPTPSTAGSNEIQRNIIADRLLGRVPRR